MTSTSHSRPGHDDVPRVGHAAVIGSPVGHSLSPAIHGVAFTELEIKWDYRAIETGVDQVPDVIEKLRTGSLDAVSVTMPLKGAVIPFLDDVSDDAQFLQAVNCVFMVNGRLTGVNTDGDGARDALVNQGGVQLSGATVVVLGAGGTARAVTLALLRAGARCHMVNRTSAKVDEYVDAMRSRFPQLGSNLSRQAPRWFEVDVVVNATSVGMNSDEMPLSSSDLHGSMVVLDAVYQPLETRLLREAQSAGARVVDGLWMLIYQAKSQQQHWFGRSGSPESMRAESLRVLAARSH